LVAVLWKRDSARASPVVGRYLAGVLLTALNRELRLGHHGDASPPATAASSPNATLAGSSRP
jgi:hypothetical protein